MKAAWNTAKRVVAIIAVAAAGLAGGATVACVPAHAAASPPTVTVIDRPGAPRAMLHQLEQLAGKPLAPLSKVVAVDTAGKSPTNEQIDALLAGKDVDGIRVLGVIPASEKVLDTTMADLSDGRYDGTGGTTPTALSLVFGAVDPYSVPDHRDFCKTVCTFRGGAWNCPWDPPIIGPPF